MTDLGPQPDAFAAIAEPKRRQILTTLAERGELPVTALVTTLDLAQPAVSKHLAVLRHAGLVAVTRRGRERLYRIEPKELQAVHAWIAMFERFWTHQIDRIAAKAERAAGGAPGAPAAARDNPPSPRHKESPQ